MQRFSVPVILSAALALSSVGGGSVLAQGYGAPGGSYQQSCNNIRMRGNTLIATCTAANGQWVRSSLDVSGCRGDIANINGTLECNGGGYYGGRNHWNNALPSGTYLQSCNNEHMRGNMLVATCTAANGQWITSTLDVGRCRGDIGNVNGYLRCNY